MIGEMVDYNLTTADIVILVLVLLIAVMLYLHRPRPDEHVDQVERHYVLGVNAARVGWDSEHGRHKFIVTSSRATDMPPGVGDMVMIEEHAGRCSRYHVIQSTPQRAPDGYNIKITTILTELI